MADVISQTKIFNIFSGSLQTTSVAKILSSYCHRYIYEYIPHRDLWINRLYFKIWNSTEKEWLTIDTCDVNNLEPSKFRTGAENGHQQICYFNGNKEDKIFNRFLAARKETSADEIIFSIANLIDKSNNLEKACYKIENELILFGTGGGGGVQNSPLVFFFKYLQNGKRYDFVLLWLLVITYFKWCCQIYRENFDWLTSYCDFVRGVPKNSKKKSFFKQLFSNKFFCKIFQVHIMLKW